MANWKPFYKYRTSRYTQQRNAMQRGALLAGKKRKPLKKGRAKK